MKRDSETILVTSYAKVPQKTAMDEQYKFAGIILEIDVNNNRIVNAEFTFVTSLAKDFIARILIGYDLSNGVEDLINEVERRFVGPSVHSVIVGIKSAYNRYLEHMSTYKI